MEPDEWIRGEAAGPAGAEGDDGWPHDGWPAAARLGGPGKDRGHGGAPGFSVRTASHLVATAIQDPAQ